MRMDVGERQRELQHQRRQREIGSASLGEGPCHHHCRRCQRAVPFRRLGLDRHQPNARNGRRFIYDLPALDEENMADRSAMSAPSFERFLRGSWFFESDCTTFAGSVMRSLTDRIGWWKDAVIDRAGFANEAKPLELGFRNKSYDLTHPGTIRHSKPQSPALAGPLAGRAR